MPPKRSPSSRPAQSASPQAAPRSAAVPAPPPAVPAVEPALSDPGVSLPNPHGWWRVAAYLLSFFVPGAGLTLALLYWRGPDGRSLRFSRWCLALGVAGALVAWAGGALWSDIQNTQSGIQPW